jgi:ribosomal protein L23
MITMPITISSQAQPEPTQSVVDMQVPPASLQVSDFTLSQNKYTNKIIFSVTKTATKKRQMTAFIIFFSIAVAGIALILYLTSGSSTNSSSRAAERSKSTTSSSSSSSSSSTSSTQATSSSSSSSSSSSTAGKTTGKKESKGPAMSYQARKNLLMENARRFCQRGVALELSVFAEIILLTRTKSLRKHNEVLFFGMAIMRVTLIMVDQSASM